MKTNEAQRQILDEVINDLYDDHLEALTKEADDPTKEPFRLGVRFGSSATMLEIIAQLRDMRNTL